MEAKQNKDELEKKFGADGAVESDDDDLVVDWNDGVTPGLKNKQGTNFKVRSFMAEEWEGAQA